MIRNDLYWKDVRKISELSYEWDALKNQTLLITGSNGMIGSFFVDIIMDKNERQNLQCQVIAVDKSEIETNSRYGIYLDNPLFSFVKQNVVEALDIKEDIDYIVHAASNTRPIDYTENPIGIISTATIGTYNMLDLGVKKNIKKFVFTSSVEMYGQNRNDVDFFEESYCGNIDCSTVRASYPEGKRAGEVMCQAFAKQEELDISVLRIPRTYGSSFLPGDTKTTSLFVEKASANEDIELKSAGTQKFSYCYVADVASALIYILLKGKSGEAYNVAPEDSNISLKEFAERLASEVGRKVVINLSSDLEKQGYSNVTKAMMREDKLHALGWNPSFSLEEGIRNTIAIMRKGNED